MNYVGTSGPNVKNGTSSADTMSGLGGNDTLDGRGGNDKIFGGDGDDQVFDSGGGNDSISGGAGNDLVYDQAGGADTLDGGSGNDFVSGNLNDKLIGGAGTDSFYLNMGASTAALVVNLSGQLTQTISLGQGTSLTGFESGALHLGTIGDIVTVGNDAAIALYGGGGADILTGGSLNDYLEGEAGADTLRGGAGKDTLRGGAGEDLLVGGVGDKLYGEEAGQSDFDSFSLDLSTSSSAVDVILSNLGQSEVNFGNGTLLSHMDLGTLILGGGDDAAWQALAGFELTVRGGGGDDRLHIEGIASDIYGDAGNDTLDGYRCDVLDGGTGTDSFSLDLAGTAAVTATLTGLAAGTVTLGATVLGHVETGFIEFGSGGDNITLGDDAHITLQGGEGADTLTGGLLGDTLRGGNGADSLTGNGGADSLEGGFGDDRVFGGVGDYVSGGEGVDYLALYLEGLGQSLACHLQQDVVVYMGGVAQAEIHDFETGEFWLGSGGDDFDAGYLQTTAHGGLGDDTLTCTASAGQKYYGDNGDDELSGGSGSDLLSGGAGLDVLIGNGGGDTLFGGGGADVYLFLGKSDSLSATPDLIQGLQNSDVIDLSAIDANGNVAGDGAFTIVAAFTHTRGELVRSYDSGSGKTSFMLDINGDGTAEQTIQTDADNSGYANFVL